MLKKIKQSLLVAALAVTLLTPAVAFAGSPRQQACEGAGGTWSGADGGTCTNTAAQGGNLMSIVTTIINTLFFVAGIVAVIMIIIGGFRYITAQGDSGQLTTAKNTILYSVVGLVIVIASFAIVNFVLDQF